MARPSTKEAPEGNPSLHPPKCDRTECNEPTIAQQIGVCEAGRPCAPFTWSETMHSEATPILHETLGAIREILGSELDGITVERAVVGLFFTGVELSNGITGACATPIKTIPEAVCCPSSAMAMPFPGKLRGRPAFDLAREALGNNGIRRAVGIAAMNALADTCWRRRPHPATELRLGVDAFDATEIRPGDTVVVVGAFVPFLRELKRRR